MEASPIVRIIRKYLSERFSPETEEKVQRWMIKDKYPEEKEKASLACWNELEAKADPDTHLALERVNKRIARQKLRPLPFHQRISRIAAILIPLFIIAGGYLYHTSTRDNLIEISATYGENKHLLLPDSSEIWLNAGTVIKYPKRFSDSQRLVHLDGEAYFSVKKDASHPFIVKTPQLSVKVLGTQFNVKAYADEPLVTTTLTSGKVEITPSSQDSRILKPNEQLTYNKHTSGINITEVPAADADSWITGKLIFTHAPFTEIIRTLERRYNVTFTTSINVPASRRYTVRFLKNENLDEILTVLKEMIGFRYRQEGTEIELSNNP